MNPFQRFGSWVKGLFGPADTAHKSAQGLLDSIMIAGQAPRRGTRELAIAYKRLPMIHSVVQRIAQDIASSPWKIYRGRKGKGAKRYRHAGRHHVSKAVRVGDLTEIDTHPFFDLMDTMNPALGGIASRMISQVHLELNGESFEIKERNGLKLPLELWPVPSHWIMDLPHKNSPFFRASWLGWQRMLPENDVAWLKYPDAENPYGRGAGIGTALADELDVDEFATKHIRNYFHNNALPPAIVNVKGMSADETERYREKWLNELKGSDKFGLIKFTNAESVTVSELNNTFRDTQLVELRKAVRDILRETFNMPPELIGLITNSNRATIDSAYYLYSKGVLVPRLDFNASQMQSTLDEFDDGLLLGYESPVPEDYDFTKAIVVAVPSVFKVDEIRDLADMEPLPNGEGDVLYQPPLVVRASEAIGGQGGLAEPTPLAPSEAPQGEDSPSAQTQPAAPDPEPEEADPTKAARGRSLRPVGKGPADGGGENPLEALRAEYLSAEVMPLMNERMERWGQRVLDQLGVDARFDIRNPEVRKYLGEFSANQIRDINDTTKSALQETLAAGAAAGEGIDDLAARVAEVFDAAEGWRSRLIARTEVIGAANFGNLSAFLQSGVVANKEWLSVQDENTREDHAILDGAVVGVRAAFVTSSGAEGQHPGGFDDPAEDCNCRCAVLPVVDAPEKAATDRSAIWKDFNVKAAAWERAAGAAFRRGFRKQRELCLKALRKS